MREAQQSQGIERFKTALKAELLSFLERDASAAGQGRPDRQPLEAEGRRLAQRLVAESPGLSLGTRELEEMVHDLLDDVVGLGPIDPLVADPTITEIMVNGPRSIYVERGGVLHRVDGRFRDPHHLMTVIERLLNPIGVSVNETDPICDATLQDGSRINVILPPLVVNGPVVTIRRALPAWAMAEYIATGALSRQAAEWLAACVSARVNVILSGGTSTGKTTLVSLLSEAIPSTERIVTIENSPELRLPNREHWIQLVAKTPNLEGRGEISLRTLVRNALRMRPDRIILGEARGGEALDVVQAMHTGHEGVITVLHANSPQAALERLETLMLMSGLNLPPQACQAQISSAVDLIVHLARYTDGSRRVASIAQVMGSSGSGFQLEELFRFEARGFRADGRLEGELRYTGARPKFLQKFHVNNVPVPAWISSDTPH